MDYCENCIKNQSGYPAGRFDLSLLCCCVRLVNQAGKHEYQRKAMINFLLSMSTKVSRVADFNQVMKVIHGKIIA